MNEAYTSGRWTTSVAASRRMYQHYLACWASDYLRFQSREGRRCGWAGGAAAAGEGRSPLAQATGEPLGED